MFLAWPLQARRSPIMTIQRFGRGMKDDRRQRRPVTLNETAVARVTGAYTGRGITFDFVRNGQGVTGYWRAPLHKCWRKGRAFVPLSERSFFSEDDPESGIEFDDERGGKFTTFRFVNVLEPMEPYTATRVP
jgi:hypothetical protein